MLEQIGDDHISSRESHSRGQNSSSRKYLWSPTSSDKGRKSAFEREKSEESRTCAQERLMLHAPPSKMEYKENRE